MESRDGADQTKAKAPAPSDVATTDSTTTSRNEETAAGSTAQSDLYRFLAAAAANDSQPSGSVRIGPDDPHDDSGSVGAPSSFSVALSVCLFIFGPIVKCPGP
jgi:hypothetical protein